MWIWLVTGWAMQGKGRALWCVGEQLYEVQTVLHPAEQILTYTTDASRPQPELPVKKLALLVAALLVMLMLAPLLVAR